MNNTDFPLPKDAYAAFDAISLRNLIIDRLNEQGTFTDQNYVGSNLASVIDIVSYAYNTLIYYLNKTSSESMFSEAQLYENINRIVKTIDYKPIGFQTSTLAFEASAVGYSTGLYTIPRYSYVTAYNTSFAFNEDVTFYVDGSSIQRLDEMSEKKLMFQGTFVEHPAVTAAGDENEVVVLNSPEGTLVDHFNVFVYVRETATGKWVEYTEVPNLFLSTSDGRSYERRLNENKKYEIKFGDGVSGKRLVAGDLVAIYYLASNGNDGVVGPHTIRDSARATVYNTQQYNQILADINEQQFVYTTSSMMQDISFDNVAGSTYPKEAEDAKSIRAHAPGAYQRQHRLVTASDFESYVSTNFSYILSDVKVANNWDYTSGYLKYFYDLGAFTPAGTTNALINQVRYADACNFNNIYLVVVPRLSKGVSYKYLSESQKDLIMNAVQPIKMLTTEVSFVDPIYKAIDIGLSVGAEASPGDALLSRLEVVKSPTSKRNDSAIVSDVASTIISFFSQPNARLGAIVDVAELQRQIQQISGVQSFSTVRADNDTIRVRGLSLILWNPSYPDRDVQVVVGNTHLTPFEYPYFNSLSEALASKIYIKQSSYTVVEY